MHQLRRILSNRMPAYVPEKASAGILYVAPEMIVHYIEAHGYAPPESEEYQRITETVYHLHRARVARKSH